MPGIGTSQTYKNSIWEISQWEWESHNTVCHEHEWMTQRQIE